MGAGEAVGGASALTAAAPVAGMLARSTGTVIRRGAPLLDAASPSRRAPIASAEGGSPVQSLL